MNFTDIRPFVRFCQSMKLGCGWKQGRVRAYDHRLFFVLRGKGSIQVGNTNGMLAPGTVAYWPSGTSYQLVSDDEETLELIGINFDFTQEHSATEQYLPLVSENEYCEADRLETFSFQDAPSLNDVILLENHTEIGSVLKIMADEACRPEAFSAFYLSSLLTAALNLLVRQAEGSPIQKSSVRKILDYIHNHFSEPLTNSKLGAIFGYHPNYISQLVRLHTGVSLHRYLLKLRIDQAVLLLSSTDIPISEIAASVGFRDASYFSHYFRLQTGYSPSKIRVTR